MIDFSYIDPVLVRVAAALDLHFAQLFLDMRTGHLQARHPVDNINGEAKAVYLIIDRQLQRHVDVAFLLQIDHARRQIIARTPIRMYLSEFLFVEGWFVSYHMNNGFAHNESSCIAPYSTQSISNSLRLGVEALAQDQVHGSFALEAVLKPLSWRDTAS